MFPHNITNYIIHSRYVLSQSTAEESRTFTEVSIILKDIWFLFVLIA